MIVVKTALTIGSYAAAFVTAGISDSIVAAIVAGAFGLTGVVLQTASTRRASRAEQKADQLIRILTERLELDLREEDR